MGRNPFDLLNEDSIGQGLQIALLDLAGKAAGIPVYRLLGEKVRDECPFSWWAIDMPPEDWVEEVKLGLQLGYMSSKLKARPWFDIFQQMDAVSEAVPRGFTFSIDFNFFLRNAATAIPL
ncbi:enolase, partial [bacterium]